MGSDLIRLYSEVEATYVKWVWYPYIPSGKITILQGDPGDGKSLLIVNIIAAITSDHTLPGDSTSLRQGKVIYQCSEDGLADTIKPRLQKAGADCSKVAFIHETECGLTLDDERLRNAIQQFRAKLVVIDPVQAYLGDAEISNAKCIRRIMRRLSLWADMYDCAVVLVGHLNKNEHSKDLYRSLGSIDIMAAARSVLQIERGEESGKRIICQLKNSLAPFGQSIGFQIVANGTIVWDEVASPHADATSFCTPVSKSALTKQEIGAKIIRDALSIGPRLSVDIFRLCEEAGISTRTAKKIKTDIGVNTYKKGGQWYWCIDCREEDAEP